MFTQFRDMHGRGRLKTPYDKIYIEAPEDVAAAVFEEIFSVDPYYTTCNCCGSDFNIHEGESLEEMQQYDRDNDKVIVYRRHQLKLEGI